MRSDDRLFESAECRDALARVAHLYSQNLGNHGLSSKSVGWNDDASHLLRFQKLATLIDLTDVAGPVSVNDLGSGYGAMFLYLRELLGERLGRYYGYDISGEMLEAAARHVVDPRVEWMKSPTATHVADYSFVSGTFNVRMKASDALWTAYIKEQLCSLAAHSSRGFAFNLLTTYVDWKQDNLYYGDPWEFFDFCKRNLSRYVSVLHDYPLYEWTIVVRVHPR